MLRVRDSEDIKSLGRIGLSRSGFNEEESIKLGFPIGPAYAVNAVESRPMESLEYNVDAVIAGKAYIYTEFENVYVTVVVHFCYSYWLKHSGFVAVFIFIR